MKNRMKKPTLTGAMLAAVALLLWVVWLGFFYPGRSTVEDFSLSENLEANLTREEALEDLDQILRHIGERHPSCVEGLPAEVKDAYTRESQILAGMEQPTVADLWRAVARVCAVLGDAHTAVGPIYDEIGYLPLALSDDEENFLCSGETFADAPILSIGGAPIADLYETFRRQFSYELESYARYNFATRIPRSDCLFFLGIEPAETIAITWQDPESGEVMTEDFPFHHERYETEEAEEYLTYTFEPDQSAAIFTLRQCRYNERYEEALKSFFSEVKQRGVHHIILDLRDNPGGNSLVADAFIRYLPAERYESGGSQVRLGPLLWKNKARTEKNERQTDLTFPGDLYVLTATQTFSAAVDFAVLLADNQMATVVGEIPGNMPSSYGDILRFQTPNAKLAYTVSYKYFTRPDTAKSQLPLVPDREVPAGEAMAEARRLIAASP